MANGLASDTMIATTKDNLQFGTGLTVRFSRS